MVSYSDDDGATWSAPVVGTTKTASSEFDDKNSAEPVDTSPASPYFGRVYLSWTEFRSATSTGNGAEPVMVAASSDGGLSFGAPKQLSPAGNNGTGTAARAAQAR